MAVISGRFSQIVFYFQVLHLYAESAQGGGRSSKGGVPTTHPRPHQRMAIKTATFQQLSKYKCTNLVVEMSFHQSLDDLLSAQDLDEREYHSDTESELDLRRPASTPPHGSPARPHRQDIDLDEQVIPSLRAQDLAGRIRSFQGLLWRRNAKGRARGWTNGWFKVSPGRSLCIHNTYTHLMR